MVGDMNKEVKRLLHPIILLGLLIILSSQIFFILCRTEGRNVPYLQCLYMVVITISTIGYGDLIDTASNKALIIFNMAVILSSMVIVAYTVSNFTAFLVEGRLSKYFILQKQLKRIKRMNAHYIICGVKDIGVFAARELAETKRPFVVIDDSLQAIESLRQEIPSLVYFEGDATDDNLLTLAGIGKARALIASLDSDKENLYLVMAARELNPNLQIAAKFNTPKNRAKMVKAGTTCIVSPNMIGGMRIASELLRPRVVGFLDRMLRDKAAAGIRLEEFVVPEKSSLIGKTLRDLYHQTGVLVFTTLDPGTKEYRYNPDPGQPITAGTTLIYISSPDQRISLENL
jgi:voltage-gated potassium channel